MSDPSVPMLLDDDDRETLMLRVLEKAKVRYPSMQISRAQLWALTREAADELVAGGGFTYNLGVLIRWPPDGA